MPWSEVYSHSGPSELSFDNKLTTLSVLPVQWMITFEFMPTTSDNSNWSGPWLNVLMVTTLACGPGPNHCRVPAVFFSPNDGAGIMVQWQHDGFGRHTVMDLDWSLSDWTKIQISQETEGGQIVCRVNVNGVEKLRETNPDARELTNLDVYASDPWHPIQTLPNPSMGSVRGLSIQTKGDPKPRIGH